MAERQRKPHGVERLSDPRPNFVAGNTEVFAPEGNVVPHPRQNHLAVGVLQHQPRASPSFGGRHTVEEKLTMVLPLVIAAEHPGQGVQER